MEKKAGITNIKAFTIKMEENINHERMEISGKTEKENSCKSTS